jgi:hypothetical protein
VKSRGILVLGWLLGCSMLHGQTGLATLTGAVTDQTGAVIAGVMVEATQVATGTRVAGATSETGNFTLSQLRPGDYDVVIEQSGFKAYRRTGLTLGAAQTLRLDVQLEVGAITDSVTVTAEASLLKTESGTMVHNITPAQIQALPLLNVGAGTSFIRDPFQLSLTMPGVVSGGVGVAPRVNGLPSTSNQYRLDGEVLGQLGAATITTRTQPSPDSIEEVAVQTSNFAAEFGSASGAVFNVTIKSGTNQFHGTVYDYMVNEFLNSEDSGVHLKNRIRRHDYGFTIGGPIKIPGVYDGKNKSFFFANWEQYRDKVNLRTFTIPTVPTQAYRNGDFSGAIVASGNLPLRMAATTGANARPAHDYLDPLGNTIQLGTVFDPRSTQTVTCNTAVSGDCGVSGAQVRVRSPFPGNRMPTTLFDPVSVAVLNKYIPLPQGPNADLGVLINNYYNPFDTARITRSPALKFDQSLGNKGRLSFTWTDNHTESAVQNLGAEGFVQPVSANRGTYESSPTYRTNFDYTIRPTLSLHLGAGWSTFDFLDRSVIIDYNPQEDIGLRGATVNRNFPRFGATVTATPAVGGLNALGPTPQSFLPERRPSGTMNLTWIHNNHTIKYGADFRQDMLTTRTFNDTAGNFGFGGNGLAWQPALQGVTGFTGNTNVGFGFAQYLMGSVRSLSLGTPIAYRRSKKQWGMFLQDTWRARRNLTIDYGLRWDYGTYTSEDYGRVANLSLTEPNPAAGGHVGALVYEGSCKCNFASNYPYAIGPRVGFAYTLSQRTVIRGGLGIAYGSTPIVSGTAQNTASAATPQDGDDAFKLREGIPTSIAPVWPVFRADLNHPVGQVIGAPAALVDPNAGRPDRTFQWNFSLQRELSRNLVVEASYVGNRNVWQSTGGLFDFNAVSVQQLAKYGFTIGNVADGDLLNRRLDQLSTADRTNLSARGVALPYGNFPTNQTVFQSLRNFPQYSGGISPTAPLGKSWYDSFQLSINKRYSSGLQLNANYTYSKNLQHTSAFDIFNRSNGKDIVGGNPPQILRISFLYELQKPSSAIPFLGNRWVANAIAGWGISGALFYQTGAYIGRPASGAGQPISRWLGRGPGGAQLRSNPDGSYMSPWAVNWKDLDGKIHPEPLDINCHCFDPETTIVLNPAAWQAVPDGVWSDQTQILPQFRAARRPNEAMNLARNFRFGADSRYTLQVRVEFQNILNRRFLAAPQGAGLNFTTVPVPTADGRYTSGFGTFGNLRNANQFGTPRSGQFIARFSF